MAHTDTLRALLDSSELLVTPGCYDALSARLIERAGFPLAFMSGFGVAAARLGMPDTGLISYTEMVDQGRDICSAVNIPVIGDGDTGYGNALNVQRTVRGYAQAGFACIMIEDQVTPKRCGHTRGKQTVDRAEAFARVQAAVDTREAGADILVMARTDANATLGLDEAITRANAFVDIGVDITFLEAPRDEDQMRAYCEQVPGPKMANMVPQGDTPMLTPATLQALGYQVAIYPISLMLAGIHAMEETLRALHERQNPSSPAAEFPHLREIIGFPDYYAAEQRYADDV